MLGLGRLTKPLSIKLPLEIFVLLQIQIHVVVQRTRVQTQRYQKDVFHILRQMNDVRWYPRIGPSRQHLQTIQKRGDRLLKLDGC